MHVTTVISAVITLVGALVVLAWMPGRPAASAELAEDPAREDTEVVEPVPRCRPGTSTRWSRTSPRRSAPTLRAEPPRKAEQMPTAPQHGC